MLSRRQISVQRDNLVSICRISVKALIDYACLNTHVDDGCEEFINFCAAFEHLVSHRLRPNQKKVWLPRPGPPAPRHFWDVLLDTQSRANSLYFQSCVPNIDAIESFKSPQAKLRAFFRVALMEKRLSDYIMWVLDHQLVLRDMWNIRPQNDEAMIARHAQYSQALT
ncbi:RUN domain-containing protein 3B [Elysia marginata]|uniref:RUN domain-containing protein 3B n=1 Tax=Elysia marginata TaxID=1093978 RepID=A0AAV4HRS7_9GAST|nr:RUN domain-containing protein 3B [Elysia marginata]